MRIISFCDVKFVRAILEGRKTQTIRPLKGTLYHKVVSNFGEEPIKFKDELKYNEPIHKVGDKVKLVYKQRVLKAGETFCSLCGCSAKFADEEPPGEVCIGAKELPKHFATAEIIEVEEIEMWSGNDASLIKGYRLKDTYKLADDDGFEPGEDGKYVDFYNWFCCKRYGWLDTPKRFAVYRWKLI